VALKIPSLTPDFHPVRAPVLRSEGGWLGGIEKDKSEHFNVAGLQYFFV
jgi:hypothetical protein